MHVYIHKNFSYYTLKIALPHAVDLTCAILWKKGHLWEQEFNLIHLHHVLLCTLDIQKCDIWFIIQALKHLCKGEVSRKRMRNTWDETERWSQVWNNPRNYNLHLKHLALLFSTELLLISKCCRRVFKRKWGQQVKEVYFLRQVVSASWLSLQG